MKHRTFLIGSLLLVLASIFSMSLVLHQSLGIHAEAATTPTLIFADKFDKYAVGPLPTGLGQKWSAVVVKGSGAVAVTNTVAFSKPNSLQITLGATLKSQALARAKYTSGTATHAARFALYLDKTLKIGTQLLTIFGTENKLSPTNGSFTLSLDPSLDLVVAWYDSTGTKHNFTETATSLTRGQWYYIELDQTNSATAGIWTLYLNGTQVATQTAIDTGNTLIDEIFAGTLLSTSAAVTGSYYIDGVETSAQHIG